MGINVTLQPMEDVFESNSVEEVAEHQNGASNIILEEPTNVLTEKENVNSAGTLANSVSSQFSPEELLNLKQCRNRAYAKVNQKKRMHLNASLSGHIQKEWLALYPQSQLSGKKLLEIFETHAITAAMNDEPKKSNRGRKRKQTLEPAPVLCQPPEVKRTKSEAVVGAEVISEATHEDRQWTDAMLSNLMYCNRMAEHNKTDLESEWLVLYPNSALSARNLKSRLTVYQRTHSEKSAPKKPTREKGSSGPKTPKVTKSQSEPASSKPVHQAKQSPTEAVSWSEDMIKDMFETLDTAREELNSTDNDVIGNRWHCLWSMRHPSVKTVDSGALYAKYLDQVKKSSMLTSPRKSPQVLVENCQKVKAEKHVEDIESEPSSSSVNIFQWSDDLLVELRSQQQYVEEKLRCIQDEYFFELLQERWSNLHPECKDTPDQLKVILQDSIKKEVVVDNNQPAIDVKPKVICEDFKDEFEAKVEDAQVVPNNDIINDDEVKDELEEDCIKEEPFESVELPKTKWICDKHYIHLFYDDQDKSHECILTEQLLQMRNDLIPKFPGHDLFKGGKKPTGFAKMLLSQWLSLYPGKAKASLI